MKVLLGICGSIAAYKTAHLVRLLVKDGHELKVVMTPSAQDFITPLTLATLSRNPVHTSLFNRETGEWVNHVALGNWADLMLIAPASANTLGKMVNGLADNLLLTTYLSATCPVYFAPAMDRDMYLHPSTQANIKKLQEYGNILIPPAEGELASGLEGVGRMAEPEEIVDILKKKSDAGTPLNGKTVLITAGPTHEPIDPVRFIGNHSSGKMGFAIAEAFAELGAQVQLVSGPVHLQHRHPSITRHNVTTAQEMYERCMALFPTCDMAILSAAVADFRPEHTADRKIKKQEGEDTMSLKMVKNKDILASLGAMKRQGQILAGFSLETHNAEEFAREKLSKKNCDMIIMNSLEDDGAGFAGDTNKITIIASDGETERHPLKSKQHAATDIANFIIRKYF